MSDLMNHIEKLHTTDLGAERIKRNLQLDIDDVIEWCKVRIMSRDAKMERIGKNWYVTIDNCKITVNAHSYTIITVHRVK